ncbi:MAG: LysR family transcriptional regulator [Peptostreptococcaceae bacterium]
MTIRSLEIFVSVVKCGKMSEASKQLHISQPTISQAINELEKEYDVLLFNRLSKKLYLTDAGRQLLNYAQSILSLCNEMNKTMFDWSNHKAITLGATMTVGKCVLVDIIKKFEEAYPGIKIQVTIDNTETIEQLLLDSKIDIALVEGTIKSNELIINPIIPDSLVLVCHQDHTLANRNYVHINELSNYSFILREKGSGTREVFESHLSRNHVDINVKWNCHGSDSIVEAVLANQGITVISKRLIESYVESGHLKIVPIKDIVIDRNFSLVYHKTKYLTNHLQEFINYIS